MQTNPAGPRSIPSQKVKRVSILADLVAKANKPISTASPKEVQTYQAVTQNHYFDLDLYPQRYYLELLEEPGKEPYLRAELPFVGAIMGSSPLAVTRTWHADGTLYEEHSGFMQRAFKLSGRSGYSPNMLTRFHGLRNFFERYARDSADNKNAFVRGKDITLVINFPWEGESYYATLIEFKYTRALATSRVSFEYEVMFLTNGFATRKWTLPANVAKFIDCQDSGGGDNCHTGYEHPCHKEALLKMEEAPPGEDPLYDDWDDTEETVMQVSGKGPAGENHSEFKRANGEIDAGRTGLKGKVDPEGQRLIANKARTSRERTYELWDDMDAQARADARNRMIAVLGWYSNVEMTALATLGFLFEKLGPRTSVTPGSQLDRRYSRPIPIAGQVVTEGTYKVGYSSLIDMAQDLLGNRDLWRSIAQLNGMQSPRYKPNGALLQAGDKLLVPAVANAGLPANGGDLYGTDVRLVDGDLVPLGTSDIATISGLPNFAQNLDGRLRTVRPQNKAFPKYGMRKLIGSLDAPAAEVMSDTKIQLLADHRTRRLTELDVVEQGDRIEVKGQVEAITGQKAPVTADFLL